MLAAPVLAGNLLAPDYKQSLAFLLVGFALSEMWRAPAAIMIRDVSPPNLGSTGSALHLCVRNFTGSLGPLGAQLSPDTLLCAVYAKGLVFAPAIVQGVTSSSPLGCAQTPRLA